MRLLIAVLITSLLLLASTPFAFYFGGFGGYSYSNYGYSGGVYYPSSSYRSTGYYSNPFGTYYGGGFGGYQRSSVNFFYRSW